MGYTFGSLASSDYIFPIRSNVSTVSLPFIFYFCNNGMKL